MIYMIVTLGGVWDWEQKTKLMQMSALWQRFSKKKKKKKNDNETEATDELLKNIINEFLR